MRPHQHARSSARGARPWRDDLAVHEFLDVTKFACADRRHRAVLHHLDLGGEIAARAFPERHDIAAIVQQHVVEDLGHPVRFVEWFQLCDVARLPAPVQRRVANGPKGVARLVARRLPPSARTSIEQVCELLFLPLRYLPVESDRALPLLMNCAGPMIVRHMMGPPAELTDGTIVDYGWIAEAAIFTAFGRIPDLGEVVRCWTAEPTRCEAAER